VEVGASVVVVIPAPLLVSETVVVSFGAVVVVPPFAQAVSNTTSNAITNEKSIRGLIAGFIHLY
jgi:hypothetical protein